MGVLYFICGVFVEEEHLLLFRGIRRSIVVHPLDDLTPTYFEDCGLKSVPKSVAYVYTASGYGFVQDMPYALHS